MPTSSDNGFTNSPAASETPGLLVSVIVPTYNRLPRLQQVIAALEQQQFPPRDYEIIIVSDGSTDGTDSFLAGLQSVRNFRWFSQPNRGPAAARNLGVSKANGAFILFIDDDVVASPRLLDEHMRAHCDSQADVVVVGPLISPDGFIMSAWVRWEQEMLMKQYRALRAGEMKASARQFYTGNASVRRSHILAVGGFDESFRRAEDVELAYRLAARQLSFVFNWAAAGNHFAERSFRSWFETAYTYGRNDIIFARDRGQGWLLGTLEREFRERNVFIRLLVRTCIDRPYLRTAACNGLKLTANVATWFKAPLVEKKAYSGLFNIQYYSGLYDEFDDENVFCKTGGRNVVAG